MDKSHNRKRRRYQGEEKPITRSTSNGKKVLSADEEARIRSEQSAEARRLSEQLNSSVSEQMNSSSGEQSASAKKISGKHFLSGRSKDEKPEVNRIKHSGRMRKISSAREIHSAKTRRVRKAAGHRFGAMDYTFLIVIMVLLVMGIIMMFSASYVWALNDPDANGDGAYYAKHQIIMAVAGIGGMLLISLIDYHIFQKKLIAFGIYGISLLMLALVQFTPLGITQGGAKRWLRIPGITSFQPSEIVKFSIIIIFSYLIAKYPEKMKSYFKGIIPLILILAPVCVFMIKQPHLSGTIIIFLTAFAIVFVGGIKITHLLGSIAAAALVGIAVYSKMEGSYEYIGKRFLSWREPFSDIGDTTWQTCQSLIAIGSGGIFGLGLGNSRQKFLYLPETKNDFVFAIVCEELGLIGAMMVIVLFLLFVFRGFYIATKSKDKFGMLLAFGLTVQIGIQAFFNIAVVTNSIPNTGISLPFFSYGGTALVMQLWQMGVILNISRQMRTET